MKKTGRSHRSMRRDFQDEWIINDLDALGLTGMAYRSQCLLT
ncbi:MAG: hypothetical protein NTV82_01050 [Candidatus Aminicenantes bacterium]|nr:hypothetical protein [Candidatus Aminicenantes bacterium]